MKPSLKLTVFSHLKMDSAGIVVSVVFGGFGRSFRGGYETLPSDHSSHTDLRPQAALSRQRDTEADARHELAAGSSGIGPHCSTPTKYWVGFPTRFNRYYP